jgi:calcineurin-like phosphoesterase family protein
MHTFFHRNIIQYSNRPFESVEDMNEQMIQRWNKQVKKDDIVYHLGDFAFGKIDKIENLPDGQTRGIEVDLMSNSSIRRSSSRPVYESILRENLESSFL